MLIDLLLVIAGAAVLALAGDRLVALAAALAERARVTPAVIGLTVVAAGTSAPELVVSLTGALRGSPAIAVGNVVGSNIANIGLVLALCALIAPVPVARSVVRVEGPFLALVSGATLLLGRDGRIDRLEGGFLLATMVAFVAYSVRVARREIDAADARTVAGAIPARADRLSRRRPWMLALGLGASLGVLLLGAQALVVGAIGLAHAVGLSERVVGLTVVAVGTSLPELAVSVVAAVKRQHELAVANVVGSNVFNLLLILGATGLLRPLPVDPEMVRVDLWVMIGFVIVLLSLAHRRRLGRVAGAILLTGYTLYLIRIAFAGR